MEMTDDLSSPHDQPMLLTESELDIISSVDRVIEKSVASGDPRVALHYIGDLRRSGHVTGLAMAKCLYETKIRWDSFPTDDDFVDVAMAETGLGVGTIRKYIDLWEAIFVNPKVEQMVKDALVGKPIGSLYLLAPAAKEGQLDEEDWKKAAKAPDRQAVREIVQAKRGMVGPANTTLVIMIDRDGTLKARKGKGHYVPFGYLNLKLEDENAKEAIERILNYAHVVRR
jgi:hypothetical protein